MMNKTEAILFAILFLGIGTFIGKATGISLLYVTKEIHHIRLVQPIRLCSTWEDNEGKSNTMAFTWWPEHTSDVLNLVEVSHPERVLTLGHIPDTETYYIDDFIMWEEKP